MSRTFTVSGRSSSFSAIVHPPLLLDTERYEYTLALRSFVSCNSIPNVEVGVNSRMYVTPRTNASIPPVTHIFDLPDGSYEIEHLELAIREKLKLLLSEDEEREKLLRESLEPYLPEYGDPPNPESIFSLKPDNSTLKCRMKSDLFDIDFTASDTPAAMLGFSNRVYKAAELHESDRAVDIVRTLSLHIETNLTTGAYLNGRLGHVIYEFTPMADPGFIIREEPRTPTYLPLIDGKTLIDNISICIRNQDSEPVNFRGEKVVIRLELRKVPRPYVGHHQTY